MAKLKNPLLALGAIGRLTKNIIFTRRRGTNIAEKRPIPADAKTAAQLSWRHMYQKAVALWHALSASEKQEWESLARRHHMTGYAYFLSQALKPNPGLYLPLQGGVMQGDIDMAKFRLLRLPAPVDPQEPLRLADGVAVHGADKHTDVTRDLFIPAAEGLIAKGTAVTFYRWAVVEGGVNLQEPWVNVTFKAPPDFVSYQKLEAVWVSHAGAGNIYWRFRTNYAACGEDRRAHEEDTAFGVTATGGFGIINCQEPEDPLTMAGLAKGDFIGLYFQRMGDNALDTIDDVVYLYGFLLTYTADQ